ncbi:MAG: carboxymuconolactone decarboxylase family protein [Bradymonadales bacterium]|nr:carboxymuconolactone decarboxylase family protein [Bradymonadales bacterium]
MNPNPECFDRPIWTGESLVRALRHMHRHLLRVLPTIGGRPLSNRFRERLMLAVTAENRCPYCQRAHTFFGKLSGLDPQEIQAILDGQESDLPEGERVALAFVRDLARRGFQSRDEALYAQLLHYFSQQERAAIESSAHVINLANRAGNTLDYGLALISGDCKEERENLRTELLRTGKFLIGATGIGMMLGPLMVYQRIRH